jgi:hypothetical protein
MEEVMGAEVECPHCARRITARPPRQTLWEKEKSKSPIAKHPWLLLLLLLVPFIIAGEVSIWLGAIVAIICLLGAILMKLGSGGRNSQQK